jgi:uncharacterized protein
MTENSLPVFRYHPDPIRTGVVRQSPVVCACCAQARGFIYSGPVYGEEQLDEQLCPWCIAEGRAASELGASFADDWALIAAGISKETIEEINLRTPGYVSWQSEQWLSHCGDACAFHGDMTRAELEQLSETAVGPVREAHGMSVEEWGELTSHYEPGGNPALYKFICLHCGATILGMDCS